jgi:folate-binding protein YgfZ
MSIAPIMLPERRRHMAPREAPQDELAALEEGRAFVDLSAYRKVRVTGADARAWLHDLITSDVASLEPGRSQRSLLLTPTGRIRADMAVAMDHEGFLLLQAPDQPDHVGLLLGKYVLSSDVSLGDATDALSLFAVPGDAAELVGRPALAPSVLGKGVDLVAAKGQPSWLAEEALVKRGLVEVGQDAVEVWRIRRGVARMGVDFGQVALPAEVGLEWTIDTDKGCFLGQESVARVRNLGHPPRVLCHVVCRRTLEPGTPVHMAGSRVGEITSAAAASDGGTVAIGRVGWEGQAGPWTTPDGETLERVGPTD